MALDLQEPISSLAGTQRDLVAARRVLTMESEALGALASTLGESFIAALDLLESIAGRVIVTGMGKSGHIARKIAATLSSTGTPALFVHPAEASHGDLGMITPRDAVVALSNSGKTPELGDIATYTRRFGIPLIAITSRGDSTLAEASDATLLLPPVPEACPMGLAPTTSTTMSVALGDAIAIALLERRGFSAEDFQLFHPGGALGKKLLKVADLMHAGEELPLCSRATPMADAILVMTAKRFGCVGIAADDGSLLGIVTDGDLRRHMQHDLLHRSAEEVMTVGPRTIRPDALAAEALHMMTTSERPFTSIFVVEDGRPLGILHIHDLLRAEVA